MVTGWGLLAFLAVEALHHDHPLTIVAGSCMAVWSVTVVVRGMRRLRALRAYQRSLRPD